MECLIREHNARTHRIYLGQSFFTVALDEISVSHRRLVAHVIRVWWSLHHFLICAANSSSTWIVVYFFFMVIPIVANNYTYGHNPENDHFLYILCTGCGLCIGHHVGFASISESIRNPHKLHSPRHQCLNCINRCNIISASIWCNPNTQLTLQKTRYMILVRRVGEY